MVAAGLHFVVIGASFAAEHATVCLNRLVGVDDTDAVRAGALYHFDGFVA